MEGRRFGYGVSIVVNLIMAYVVHQLPVWHVPFITEDWYRVLWVLDLSIGTHIVGNLVLLAYDPQWLRHAVQIGLNLVSVQVLVVMLRVFPFEFYGFDWGVRLALLVGLAGVAIAIIVETVALIGHGCRELARL